MQSSSFEMINRPELVRVTLLAESLLVSKGETEMVAEKPQTPVIQMAEANKKELNASTSPVYQMPPEPTAYMKLNKYDFF